MINPIEHIALKRVSPTFDDRESVTALELVGKNTTKINEIIELVNKFTIDMEKTITDFILRANKDYEAFRIEMNQKLQDFIELITLRIDKQDVHIKETIEYILENFEKYMLENIQATLEKLLSEGAMDEEITNVINNYFNELKESLNGLSNEFNTYKTSNDEKVTKIENDLSTLSTDTINRFNDLQEEVDGIPRVSLDGYATEDYVDIALENVNAEGGVYEIEIDQPYTTTTITSANYSLFQEIVDDAINGKIHNLLFVKFSDNKLLYQISTDTPTNLIYKTVSPNNYTGQVISRTLTIKSTDGVISSIKTSTIDTSILAKNNTTSYDVTNNYHPAHKKYVDEESVPGQLAAAIASSGIVFGKSFMLILKFNVTEPMTDYEIEVGLQNLGLESFISADEVLSSINISSMQIGYVSPWDENLNNKMYIGFDSNNSISAIMPRYVVHKDASDNPVITFKISTMEGLNTIFYPRDVEVKCLVTIVNPQLATVIEETITA